MKTPIRSLREHCYGVFLAYCTIMLNTGQHNSQVSTMHGNIMSNA